MSSPIRFILMIGCLVLSGCGETRGRFNPASLEAEPLTPALAPIDSALTLAQVRAEDGRVDTLLVTGMNGDTVQAVVLGKLGASRDVDVFAAVTMLGKNALITAAAAATAAADDAPRESFRISELLPAGGVALRHVASGTNFPEHAEEADSDAVFNFPKFGPATPARTSVALHPGVLLDYEVEICVRFDRDIRNIADFDAALKGFFLCGDFTDRATLLRLVDADDFDSGSGFSDAKSGPDFFPTGPFIVIPQDWRSFVAAERIMTRVDGVVTQDARGGEMTLDFRELTGKVLGDATSDRFLYRGERHRLVEGQMIPRGAVLMSGTAEGVIFMAPTPWQIVKGGAFHVLTGAFLSDRTGYETVIEGFIEGELQSGRYLQAGERVGYRSSRLGTIEIEVLAPEERALFSGG